MVNFHKFLKSGFLISILMIVPSCKGIKDSASENFDVTNCLGKENLVDILVLGCGPAGLTAAIHGARSRFTTLVLEGNNPGGQLTKSSGVENYPGFPMIPGQDLVDLMRKQTEDFGAEFLADSASEVDFSSWPYRVKTENGMIIHAMTLIVTTGSSPRMLDIPGEQEYYGRGVSVCAICDGPMNKNKDVIVIGGGDSAIEEAVQLINFGVKKVTVLVRADKMRAIKSGQERLKKEENVVIKHNMKVLEIVGDGKELTGVKVFDKNTKSTYVIPANGVFLAIGSYPNTGFLKGRIDMDERNCLKMRDRSQQTMKKAVYAAGDVEAGRPRQAVIAAGMGSQACIEAVKFLSEELGLDRKFMSRLRENYYKGKSGKNNNLDKEVELKKIETAEQFKKEVLQEASKLVLVDFYTDACPSCMQMMPIISRLATDYSSKLIAVKINAAEENFADIVKQYGITRVPRLLVFKNGQIVKDIDKALSQEALEDIIKSLI